MIITNTSTELMESADIGLDIGGSLCKIAVFVPEGKPESDSVLQVLLSLSTGQEFKLSDQLVIPNLGVVHFASFPSSQISSVSKTHPPINLHQPSSSLHATGGGAHKFEADLLKLTNCKRVEHIGEIQALFDGLEFLLRVGEADEIFICSEVRFAGMVGNERQRLKTQPLYPTLSTRPRDKQSEGFLVVNIGSGVSFVDCDGRGSYTRVGGSSLGGATFHGLVTLLCGVNNFDEALSLASQGDSTKVDLLVGDIYSHGPETNKKLEDLGLRPSTLAASFGKMANSELARKMVKKSDLALACLIMVALNVAAMAHLHAVAKSRRVVLFVGSFLGSNANRRNTLACRTLTYGIEFWGEMRGIPMKAAFLKREGFLGALGALARNQKHTFHALFQKNASL